MRDRWAGKLAIAAAVLIAGASAGNPLLAQHRQGGVVRSGGPVLPPPPKPFGNGYGSAAFPGTGGPPGAGIYGGSTVRRPRDGAGGRHDRRGRGGGMERGGSYVPYLYPMYWGDTFWNNGYYPPEPVAEPAPEAAETAPPPAGPVIINQYFNSPPVNPAMREYHQGDLPPATAQPQSDAGGAENGQQGSGLYKLVFKDGTVQLVRGYSISGNTISFVTPYGSLRRVSLDQFDPEATEKLNHQAR